MEIYKDLLSKVKCEILNNPEDIFDAIEIKCENNHVFTTSYIDLKNGLWCEECSDTISQILKDLNINFEKNKEKKEYYLKRKDENILIYIGDEKEINEDYSKIINVRDIKDKDLNKKLFEAIASKNKKIIIQQPYIPTFDYEEELLTEKSGGSVIKYGICDNKQRISDVEDGSKTAVGYIRVSTNNQVVKGYSLEEQELALIKEAKNKNRKIAGLYIDRGFSGGYGKDRMAMDRMMAELKSGQIVMVHTLERWGRSLEKILAVVREMTEKGCEPYTLDQKLDCTTPQGRLTMHIMASTKQYERDAVSERVKMSCQYRKEMGIYVSKPRYGEKVNDEKKGYEKNEEERQIIKRIHDLRKKNKELSLRGFTELLNQKQVPLLRKLTKWNHKTVGDILRRSEG